MTSTDWAITALAAVLAVVLAVGAVVGGGVWADAANREHDARLALAQSSASTDRDNAGLAEAQRAVADTEDEVAGLRSTLSPEVLAAITAVQARIGTAACDQARTVTRAGTALPTAGPAIEFVAATAAESYPTLDQAGDQWRDMLDAHAVQAAIDTCAADEAARIEAERVAAEAAAAAADAAESPIGLSDCLATFPDSPGLCLDLDGDGYAGYPDSG